MLALERRNLILEKLQAEKRVVVSELSQLYDVSEETIRRDLDKLEKEGLAIKSYGGAVINEDVSIDLPFNVRKNQNVTGKQMESKGFYIPGADWIDFFNPDAAAFYWHNFSSKLLKPYKIDAWWQDATEPEN